MDQPTFADLEYQGKKRKTHREPFPERMAGLIPWQLLEGLATAAGCQRRGSEGDSRQPTQGRRPRRHYRLPREVRHGVEVLHTVFQLPCDTENSI